MSVNKLANVHESTDDGKQGNFLEKSEKSANAAKTFIGKFSTPNALFTLKSFNYYNSKPKDWTFFSAVPTELSSLRDCLQQHRDVTVDAVLRLSQDQYSELVINMERRVRSTSAEEAG